MRNLTLKETQSASGGIVGTLAAIGAMALKIVSSAAFETAATSVVEDGVVTLATDTSCETQLNQYTKLYGALPTAVPSVNTTVTSVGTNTTTLF
jgi:hypothetical protein